MHYLILIVIITIIVFYQLKIFRNTKKKLEVYISIFALKNEEYYLQKSKIDAVKEGTLKEHKNMLKKIGLNFADFEYTSADDKTNRKDDYKRDHVIKVLLASIHKNENGIESEHDNPIFNIIKSSINDYLLVNKSGVSDFHLMKDIVDRNCDAQEEEIHMQIPIPLYLGLVGTMIGILVGIGFLVIGGGLNELLGTEPSKMVIFFKNTFSLNDTANGIETLMGGVALAMISSILGIILTTFGSISAKDAKAEVEKNKHIFLSWIQAKLLPNLSSNTARTLEKMTQNLAAFNRTFSDNTTELGKALSQVNDSYLLQKQLFEEVQKIAGKDISIKNLELYNVLKNSTEEIRTLGTYLNNVNTYLASVKALNDKLDAGETRTRSIEDMAAFFKAEVEQVEARKGIIYKAVGSVDSVLQDALIKLKDHSDVQLAELKKTTGKQDDFLKENSIQINTIVSELKNLVAVKESILKFEQAALAQNNKLDKLATAIHALVNAKTEGSLTTISLKPKITGKKKALIWTSSAFGGLILLFLILANWNFFAKSFSVIISLFRF